MNPGRRYLVAAGTVDYPAIAGLASLPSVKRDLELVVGCLTSGAYGYARALVEVSQDPQSRRFVDGFTRWMQTGKLQPDDCVVLYYSGHGVMQDDELYLLTADTEGAAEIAGESRVLGTTAIAASELARAFLGSPARQMLVIIDTCYSGSALDTFLPRATRRLQTSKTADGGVAVYVIAAARPNEIANEGAFSQAFVELVKNPDGKLGGRIQPYLDPNALVDAMNKLREFKERGQIALYGGYGTTLPAFITNPGWIQGRPPGLDLEEHWLPKGGGGDATSDAWYFTGRERALRELARWLLAPNPDGRIRVVTGAAGTGKSALLGRLVTLSDKDQRAALDVKGLLDGVPADTMVPVGTIDIAVHARGKTVADVTAEIAVRSGMAPVEDPDALVARLRSDARSRAVVVDALDEAAEPSRIARTLLRDLATVPQLRLLVGSRPDSLRGPVRDRRVPSLGHAVEIDLDSADYVERRDVEDYVCRRLLAEDEPGRPTPYRRRPELARSVARAVAARAGNVFLIARIVSKTLIDENRPIEAADVATRDFPEKVGKAFEEFLQRFDRDAGDLTTRAVIELLRPLALSFGGGLPWSPLWAPLATALSGKNYFDEDITLMLERTGAFVVEASEQDRSVYRLYHEALAEHLRAGADLSQLHGIVTEALLGSVPRASDGDTLDWTRAQPYVVQHLASHAAAAGRGLDLLVMDPLYLAVAGRRDLLRALSRVWIRLSGEGPRQCASVYELASYHLTTPNLGERLAYLELAAHQHQIGSLHLWSRGHRTFAQPWRVRWSAWTALAENRLLMRGTTICHLLVRNDADEPRLVVVEQFRWMLLDLRDGELVYQPFSVERDARHLPLFTLPGAALAELDGEPILIASVAPTAEGGEVHLAVWRLADGQEIRERILLGMDRLFALAAAQDGDRCLVAVSGQRTHDGLSILELWDIGARERLNAVRSEHFRGRDTALALVPVGSGVVLVAGTDRGDLRVWQITSEYMIAEADVASSAVATLAARMLGSTLKIVVGANEILSVWDLTGDGLKLSHEPSAGHADGVVSVSLDEWHGMPVYVSGGRDGLVCMWSLANSERLSQTLLGFTGDASAAALVRMHDEHVLVTGDTQGSVRIWHAGGAAGRASLSLFEPRPISELYVTEVGGRSTLVMLSTEGHVEIRDAVTAAERELPELPDEPCTTIYAAMVDGRPVLAACTASGVLTVCDLDGGRIASIPTALDAKRMALVQADGRLLAVVLHQGRELHCIDVSAAEELAFLDLEEPSRHLSAGYLEGRPIFMTFSPFGSPRSHLLLADGGFDEVGIPSTSPGVCTIAMDGERPLLVAADWRRTIRIFDLQSGVLADTVSDDFSNPTTVAFSRVEGRRMIAIGTDYGRLLVWRDDRLIAGIDTSCTISNVAILPDGAIVVAGKEGVLVFELAH